jgi:sugar lactone lactonase YvrE
MEKVTKLFVFLITGLVAMNLQNCKKSNDIKPDAIVKQTTDSTINTNNLAALVSTKPIMVSTLAHLPGIGLPQKICSDAKGNLFVSIYTVGIYKITPGGVVTPVIEQNLGFGGLKAAKNGDIYCTSQNRIVKITQAGVLSEVKVSIGLQSPSDLAILDDGTLYIADTGNNRVVKVTPQGASSVFAGSGVAGLLDGVGNKAKFYHISTIKRAYDGYLYVVDGDGTSRPFKSVRKISINGAVVTTLKRIPFIFNDPDNNNEIIADLSPAKRDVSFNPTNTHALFITYGISKITYMTTDGKETPITQNSIFEVLDGPISIARFAGSSGISIYQNNMYIVDNGNWLVRKLTKPLK